MPAGRRGGGRPARHPRRVPQGCGARRAGGAGQGKQGERRPDGVRRGGANPRATKARGSNSAGRRRAAPPRRRFRPGSAGAAAAGPAPCGVMRGRKAPAACGGTGARTPHVMRRARAAAGGAAGAKGAARGLGEELRRRRVFSLLSFLHTGHAPLRRVPRPRSPAPGGRGDGRTRGRADGPAGVAGARRRLLGGWEGRRAGVEGGGRASSCVCCVRVCCCCCSLLLLEDQ